MLKCFAASNIGAATTFPIGTIDLFLVAKFFYALVCPSFRHSVRQPLYKLLLLFENIKSHHHFSHRNRSKVFFNNLFGPSLHNFFKIVAYPVNFYVVDSILISDSGHLDNSVCPSTKLLKLHFYRIVESLCQFEMFDLSRFSHWNQ